MPTGVGVTLTTQRFYFLHRFKDDLLLGQPQGDCIERRHLGGNYYAIRFYDGSVVIRYAYESEASQVQKRKDLLLDVTPEFLYNEDEEVDGDFTGMMACGIGSTSSSEKSCAGEVKFDVAKCQYIKLTYFEMKNLMTLYSKIEDQYQQLKYWTPCIAFHESQMAYYTCSECCPFSDDD